MKRYVVVAKVHRSEPDGDSHQDGRPLQHSFFEEQSFTLTEDQPISAIFDRINQMFGSVIEIRLLDDGSNYKLRPIENEDPVF